MVLAMIRAQVVLPTPRGPQNKKACAKVLLRMAFFNVLVIELCPTTVSKVMGLYFLADTTKFSIFFGSSFKSAKIQLFQRRFVEVATFFGFLPFVSKIILFLCL
jgi:hypothetical protein